MGLCILLVALILCIKSRRRIQSGLENFEYPFKGVDGLKDRLTFKRANAAEKGEIRALPVAKITAEKTGPMLVSATSCCCHG